MRRAPWWVAATLGLLALISVPDRAEPEAPPPDAELLLDLDLLSETDLTQDAQLLPRLELLERLGLVERLRLLESGVPLTPPRREVK